MLQVSSSPEGHLQSSQYRLVCRHAQVKQPHEIGAHRHARGQLLFTENEAIQIRIGQQHWHLAPQQAVWIPSQQEHHLTAPQGAAYFCVYADQSCVAQLPLTGGLVQLNPLTKALVSESSQYGQAYDLGSAEARLNQVLWDQLKQLKTDPLQLIMPTSPILEKLCRHVIDSPLDAVSLTQWGNQFGASERHLARKFKAETGLTYRQWRHKHDLLYLLHAHQKGESLSYIAADLGYAHSSALSKMVKKETGLSPSEWLQKHAYLT